MKKSPQIVIIMLLSMLILGGSCPTKNSNPRDDEELKDVPYNGNWTYIDSFVDGISQPLDQTLFQISSTSYATMTFWDYEDSTATNTWHYEEYETIPYEQSVLYKGGRFYQNDDTLRLEKLANQVQWFHYGSFKWAVNEDTLLLIEPENLDSYYVLIKGIREPPPPPEFLGEWQYSQWTVDGIERDLVNFYEIAQTNDARLMFLNSETYQYEWHYTEFTHFQGGVTTQYYHNGYGTTVEADSLQLTLTHRNNNPLTEPIVLPKYHWELVEDTILELTYTEQDSSHQFTLLKVEE